MRPGAGVSAIVTAVCLLGAAPVAAASTYAYSRDKHPARTVVTDSAGQWVGTFTDGSYTVSLAGPTRTFSEPTATYPVSTDVWVRMLPAPFDGSVDASWLDRETADTTADVLATAMQYIGGASNLLDSTGLRIAGDASYGPLLADGTRQEGSDFNDYLGIPWLYGLTVDWPETAQYGSLDCSGFVRMVFGYRIGLPLALAPDGRGIPRRSYQIYQSAPGRVVVSDSGTVPGSSDFAKLAAGDLVFFDASTNDGTQIDHVAIYLGRDTGGNYRFISSRKTIDGPTLGDYAGKSVLNGTGHYATSFRAVRRL